MTNPDDGLPVVVLLGTLRFGVEFGGLVFVEYSERKKNFQTTLDVWTISKTSSRCGDSFERYDILFDGVPCSSQNTKLRADQHT